MPTFPDQPLYQKIKEEAHNYDASSSLMGQIHWKKQLISWIPWSYQRSLWSLQELCEAPTSSEANGVYNFLTAFDVAADPKARDKGVLVVMNDEIHAAKYVTKTHTTNVSTFQTPTHGPIGLVMKGDPLL